MRWKVARLAYQTACSGKKSSNGPMSLLLKQDADSPDRAAIKNLKTKAISKELSTATEFPVFPIRHERQQGLEGTASGSFTWKVSPTGAVSYLMTLVV